jgi:hypothetical protein
VRLDARNPDGGFPFIEQCEQIHPSDEAGNILVASVLLNFGGPPSYPGLYAFDSSGAPLAQAVASELTSPTIGFPLRSGWLVGGIPQTPSLSGFLLSRYPPSLHAPSTAFDGSFPFAFTFRSPGGGTAVVAAASQPTPEPSCPDFPGRLFATSFDASGTAVFRDAPLGCGSGNPLVSVGRNAAGDVLALVDGRAWHLTPDGMVSQGPQSPSGELLRLWSTAISRSMTVEPGPPRSTSTATPPLPGLQ